MLSLRDAAFALDADTSTWSLRDSVAISVHPPIPSEPLSVRQWALRFSEPGAALRLLAAGTSDKWTHINREKVVKGIRERLRDPMIVQQGSAGLCGPVAIMMELIRRSPTQYVLAAKELLETGVMTCPNGRTIEADAGLRAEPILAEGISQADWLFAATMRDDANIWENVEGDASGLEVLTLWGDQSDWTNDVLNLSHVSWRTCLGFTLGTPFPLGEATPIDCMQRAEHAVKAGGVAFFLVDVNLLQKGEDDDEEDMWFRAAEHHQNGAPSPFGKKLHSKNDDFPPDHWVSYLGGLNLGTDPDDDAAVKIRVWSWGHEFEVTGTVDAFTSYLYGVVTGA